MAHLAEPEATKRLTTIASKMKATHIDVPVKPMPLRKSAPPMASMVPSLVQLNSMLNCPAKKQNTT